MNDLYQLSIGEPLVFAPLAFNANPNPNFNGNFNGNYCGVNACPDLTVPLSPVPVPGAMPLLAVALLAVALVQRARA